jgi:hypothetical protein
MRCIFAVVPMICVMRVRSVSRIRSVMRIRLAMFRRCPTVPFMGVMRARAHSKGVDRSQKQEQTRPQKGKERMTESTHAGGSGGQGASRQSGAGHRAASTAQHTRIYKLQTVARWCKL